MRLPQRPDLSWKDDGTPVDQRVDDVYYSVEDGLAESRAVFLSGCGLPEALQGQTNFTIAELGFGTGLNFLAVWQMWQSVRSPDGWLNVVSFEGFPLDREDAARALMPWPELGALARRLCEAWPVRAKGIQHLVWPDEQLSLTLHIGLIADTLPQADFKANAWFLDGFSPAKNGAMWDEALWPLIRERSAPGARAATFTVAGAVRRGLSEAGFEVEKKPGHGRKRERLEARLPATAKVERTGHAAPRVAIVGAGISGAMLARALSRRGAKVTVFDKAAGPGAGASGNPLALVMPRLDAGDTAQARLLLEAYLAAIATYRDLPGTFQAETQQRPRDNKEVERFGKLLSDPPLGLEQLEAVRDHGLLHKGSMIIEPRAVLQACLADVDVIWGSPVNLDLGAAGVNGTGYDAIFLANGWGLAQLLPRLSLTARLGQVDWVEDAVDAPPSALASGHYALAAGRKRLWGATFEAYGGGPLTPTEEARATNAEALATLDPYWRQQIRSGEVHSRASIRATTADRLPLIGRLPDAEHLLSIRSELERSQWRAEPGTGEHRNVFVAGGYGSRGFTWAPWAAAILTAELFGDPCPASRETLGCIAPLRQVLRDLKRGLI